MARAHLFLGRHLLDGIVIDLVHRIVGHCGLAGAVQQRFHQHLVALERDPMLDLVAVTELLLVGGLRQNDDVGQVGDQVFAFLIGRHLRHAGADFVFGERKIALADIDAVGAGHHRIGLLRAHDSARRGEDDGKRQRAERVAGRPGSGGHEEKSLCQGVKAPVLTGCRMRSLRSGVGADTRRIICFWQWQNRAAG